MRVGIDARELAGRSTGAGRYLRGLLDAWAASPGAAGHEFVLYAPTLPDLPFDRRRFARRELAGAAGTWWEQATLAREAARDRLDVFFAPAYTAPLRLAAPLVLAVHDVSFAAHPEWFRLREGARRRLISRSAARRAAAVITISEFSRGELQEHFGLPPERIHVIPPGITRPGGPGRPPRQATEPRVLFAGSIFNRRHVPDLVRAVGRLARRHPGVSLDIAGDNRTYPHEALEAVIAAEGMDGAVRWRQYVTDEELAALYARARAFAFLSEYEGLGLTPLEALAAGVPPVVTDTAVAREACGQAALYVPRGDIVAASNALERALFDEHARARVLEAAPAALAAYDWPRAADRTLAVLERA
jgi:glycosyltransferase involved in cell wall biosynthesis